MCGNRHGVRRAAKMERKAARFNAKAAAYGVPQHVVYARQDGTLMIADSAVTLRPAHGGSHGGWGRRGRQGPFAQVVSGITALVDELQGYRKANGAKEAESTQREQTSTVTRQKSFEPGERSGGDAAEQHRDEKRQVPEVWQITQEEALPEYEDVVVGSSKV